MAETARSFQDLIVWQKAHEMVLEVYRATRHFPKEEVYGLTSQVRRAAVSVPSNIVEGFHRRGVADKLKFLNIAEASLEELKYQLILAKDLDYHQSSSVPELLDSTGRLLGAYTRKIRDSLT
ncbi:MAG: four helix bundle protein [Verrucomicrobiales bacterium]